MKNKDLLLLKLMSASYVVDITEHIETFEEYMYILQNCDSTKYKFDTSVLYFSDIITFTDMLNNTSLSSVLDLYKQCSMSDMILNFYDLVDSINNHKTIKLSNVFHSYEDIKVSHRNMALDNADIVDILTWLGIKPNYIYTASTLNIITEVNRKLIQQFIPDIIKATFNGGEFGSKTIVCKQLYDMNYITLDDLLTHAKVDSDFLLNNWQACDKFLSNIECNFTRESLDRNVQLYNKLKNVERCIKIS